jgi:hypothetical protein
MAIIAVAGRKGGVGKSTIVGNLAAEFAAMGSTVAVLDADPQHSLVAWAAQGDGVLARSIQKVPDSADTLRSRAHKAEKDADIVLIDTPPGMPEVGYQAALAADLLLPCGPSPSGGPKSRASGSCLRRFSLPPTSGEGWHPRCTRRIRPRTRSSANWPRRWTNC